MYIPKHFAVEEQIEKLDFIEANSFGQPDYKAAMLNAIIGIEINIDEIQGKYKLSQNRPKQDQRRISEQLESTDSQLALVMKQN